MLAFSRLEQLTTFLYYIQVTEIIYVHSKMMIVDDRLTIIGSGNHSKIQ